MKRAHFFWLIVAVTIVAVPTNLVEAGLLSPNGDEQYERLDQPWNIGFSFLVNDEPVAVNALGVWEDFDGLDNEIEVG